MNIIGGKMMLYFKSERRFQEEKAIVQLQIDADRHGHADPPEKISPFHEFTQLRKLFAVSFPIILP